MNKAVTIYCASSPDAPANFLNAARELGREASRAGLATITGAGTLGLMGAVVDGTLDIAGGRAIGVIPQFMVDRGWANPRMTELHVTADMAERKHLLASLGNGAIALPGGIGTLDELMDLLAQCQLGIYNNPVVILNTDGFYDNLLAHLRHVDDCRMMRHLGLPGDLWKVAHTPAEAIELVLGVRH
ncbi:MAG: TIGR00730 family Rossman fold protein [Bacteroides sp.]|nr:TIGR00730 family Rossman fold protein [Bacteroides sp.]MCM1379051.1 TIGR00730 family Rossman fold protein [Bacteroides sp.]MCM1445749.1 TIGR00730 family Rossman fold protein [Prevotella sp.]